MPAGSGCTETTILTGKYLFQKIYIAGQHGRFLCTALSSSAGRKGRVGLCAPVGDKFFIFLKICKIEISIPRRAVAKKVLRRPSTGRKPTCTECCRWLHGLVSSLCTRTRPRRRLSAWLCAGETHTAQRNARTTKK